MKSWIKTKKTVEWNNINPEYKNKTQKENEILKKNSNWNEARNEKFNKSNKILGGKPTEWVMWKTE